ncbi:hypothetical protein P3T18_002829 [Paraburkholderia sp. GAS199]|uniref:hypothetical protein n=1 Tax=Paraburkholderia sp. GAS199 TaxID=3035126 RepID=UPI003D251953
MTELLVKSLPAIDFADFLRLQKASAGDLSVSLSCLFGCLKVEPSRLANVARVLPPYRKATPSNALRPPGIAVAIRESHHDKRCDRQQVVANAVANAVTSAAASQQCAPAAADSLRGSRWGKPTRFTRCGGANEKRMSKKAARMTGMGLPVIRDRTTRSDDLAIFFRPSGRT